MSRPQKCRRICSFPYATSFAPTQVPPRDKIQMGYDEYETIRLIDFEGFSQAQCAAKMDVARTTVTRMYANARKKLADALVHGRQLEISGGDVAVCTAFKPECAGMEGCCHKVKQ